MQFRANLKYQGALEIGQIKRLAPGQKMKLGTKLGTWIFSARPHHVSMDYTIANTPGFDPRLIRPAPGSSVEDVTGTLSTIAETCGEILSYFEA